MELEGKVVDRENLWGLSDRNADQNFLGESFCLIEQLLKKGLLGCMNLGNNTVMNSFVLYKPLLRLGWILQIV